MIRSILRIARDYLDARRYRREVQQFHREQYASDCEYFERLAIALSEEDKYS